MEHFSQFLVAKLYFSLKRPNINEKETGDDPSPNMLLKFKCSTHSTKLAFFGAAPSPVRFRAKADGFFMNPQKMSPCAPIFFITYCSFASSKGHSYFN